MSSYYDHEAQIARDLAHKHGWDEIADHWNNRLLIFERYERNGENRMQLSVWYTTLTVGSCLDHPYQGKTQLFRRSVDWDWELEELFINPRYHSGHGYQRRW